MNIATLTEHQAEFLNKLATAYPAGLGYRPENDRPVREVAAPLIDGGLVQRNEHDESGVWYRLEDSYAEEIRAAAIEQGQAAPWN